MVDSQSRSRGQYSNFKEILSEIHEFVKCPDLLGSLDDIEEEERTESDEDGELAKQLDSQLVNVLFGACGSSVCSSESLGLSEFSSEEEEDDFDKIVEEFQNTSNQEKCSMPTLSSLLTCQSSASVSPEPVEATNCQKTKMNVKKIKFAQHQTKVTYAFANKSSERLLNKIIRNNFHQKVKAAHNSSHSATDSPSSNRSMISTLENQETEMISQQKSTNRMPVENLGLNSSPQSVPDLKETSKKSRTNQRIKESSQNRLSNLDSPASSNSRTTSKEAKRGRKANVIKKAKSEIFTLKSNSLNSSLENLFNSLRSNKNH